MKTLAPSTSQYLLEAPLDVLHRESMEWIEEIAFWKDEVAFFYKIIAMAAQVAPSQLSTEASQAVEKHLIYISSEALDLLKEEALAHEKYLDTRKMDIRQEEAVYRSIHRRLSEKFHQFENEFKEMKKKVFLLVEEAVITPHID